MTHTDGLAIEVAGLTKRFGDRVAVDSVNLEVPRGTAFAFLGQNGAGKTTLIRMMLGLTRASAGEMRLLGKDVPAERASALERVGAIVEEPRFHPQLTGRENLEIIAVVRGPHAESLVDSVLERVGLAERAGDRVKDYSLGMRQRLGVARCLLADPDLLILDEPTNGLDPGGIIEMRELMRSLVDEGRTVFLSSHLLDEVEKIADAAAIVERGRVIAQGPIAELAGGGPEELLVVVDDIVLAQRVVSELGWVRDTRPSPEGLRVTLTGGADSVIALNSRLVDAGIGVSRLEPVRRTLESRFLELTNSMEVAA